MINNYKKLTIPNNSAYYRSRYSLFINYVQVLISKGYTMFSLNKCTAFVISLHLIFFLYHLFIPSNAPSDTFIYFFYCTDNNFLLNFIENKILFMSCLFSLFVFNLSSTLWSKLRCITVTNKFVAFTV